VTIALVAILSIPFLIAVAHGFTAPEDRIQ
jgi:hypothetical protein